MRTIDSNTQDILIEKIINEPQTLTAEEISLIESDRYLSDIYSAAVLCKEACTASDVVIPDIEQELHNFKKHHKPHKTKFLNFAVRIAAIFTLVLITSAIAIASFNKQLINNIFDDDDNIEETINTTCIRKAATKSADTGTTSPIINDIPLIYDNMTLRQIMSELKEIYQVNIVFENKESQNLRLYLNIESGCTITDVIEKLNSFESITATINNNDIIIK